MSAMGDHWVFLLLVAILIFLQGATALKCRTEDGPSSDEVRKVIRICMRQITTEAENKSSDEYEDYDSSYSDTESDEKDGKHGGKQGERISQSRNDGKGKNSDDRNGDSRTSERNDGRRMGENRNRKKSKDRDQDFDYYGHGLGRRSGDGRNQQSGRYKRQYYNDGSQGGNGYNYQQNGRYNRDRESFMNAGANNATNSTGNPDRDRACLMQCFFQEMKMTNNEGYPDKHKVLHVVTKDLRDHELKDFYIDSIQECFHMIGMDNKLKDKCDYSMKFVTCLAERGQTNCNDWENETILF